jgi:hypothetical protein
MIKTALPLTAPAIALALLMPPAPAQATSPMRVFVAAQGSDANPCTFALPCRTFQHAHDTVAAEGEIDVLDPAGYGALIITKSISIQGHGFSGISATSGQTGITINAGAADVVSLNGLLIEGNGSGLFGILFNFGKSLVVENCVIRNLTSGGIGFGNTTTALQTLSVSNSYIANTGGGGLQLTTTNTGTVDAAIDRSAFYGNNFGVFVGGFGPGAINATITDSVAANNRDGAGIGFNVDAPSGAANLTLTRVTASGNLVGVRAQGASATVRLAQSTLSGNGNGFSAISSGTILSYGDNYIDNNGGNTGSLGSATKQ